MSEPRVAVATADVVVPRTPTERFLTEVYRKPVDDIRLPFENPIVFGDFLAGWGSRVVDQSYHGFVTARMEEVAEIFPPFSRWNAWGKRRWHDRRREELDGYLDTIDSTREVLAERAEETNIRSGAADDVDRSLEALSAAVRGRRENTLAYGLSPEDRLADWLGYGKFAVLWVNATRDLGTRLGKKVEYFSTRERFRPLGELYRCTPRNNPRSEWWADRYAREIQDVLELLLDGKAVVDRYVESAGQRTGRDAAVKAHLSRTHAELDNIRVSALVHGALYTDSVRPLT